MSAELPRSLTPARPVAVSDCEARQARADLERITANSFRRHPEATQVISDEDDSGVERNLRLRSAGDATSFLVFSLQEFRDRGRKSLNIDVTREFKDADFFSPEELAAFALLEDTCERPVVGIRHICDYYYGMGGDDGVVWRTDWDFHHARGLSLDRARDYTPEAFCDLIMEDGGQQKVAGSKEIHALGMLLAGATTYPYEILPGAGGFDPR